MKTKTLVVVLAMAGLPLWAEDEEETEMVANALSNSQGVSYRVGNKAVLTSKGLVYRLDNNTYVGPDGIYTRLGKDWVTPSGLAARGSRGSYFGHGNGPSVKNGNGYITRGGYNYTSK